jgi:hypothetical protein
MSLNIKREWEEVYLRAALEVDVQKMSERILTAREAVAERLKELEGTSDHHAERHEMQAARAALTSLEHETRIWPTVGSATSITKLIPELKHTLTREAVVALQTRWNGMGDPINMRTMKTAVLADGTSHTAIKESVAEVLIRCKTPLINDWLARTKKIDALNRLQLPDNERTGHLPALVDDLVLRLNHHKPPTQDNDGLVSGAAVAHGKRRRSQGYSAAMLIDESRILQVTIFGTLHRSVQDLDFTQVLLDVMVIADEVDAQLTQTIRSFTEATPESAAA